MQETTKDISQYLDNKSFNPTFQVYEQLGYGYDSATGTIKAIKVDSDGNLSVDITSDDPLAKYKFTDVDADASPNYYGAVDKDGNWYILKETVSAGADTYRYVAGTSGYASAWTNRATQTYDYFFNVF